MSSAISGLFKSRENQLLSVYSLILFALSIIFVLGKSGRFESIGRNISFVYLLIFILAVISFITVIYFSKKLGTAIILKKLLLIFLASEIVWLYGIIQGFPTPKLPSFFVGLYIITAGFYFVYLYGKYESLSNLLKDLFCSKNINLPKVKSYLIESANKIKARDWKFNNRTILVAAVLTSVIIINLFFGLTRITSYSGVDEPYWTYDRIPNYWKNLFSGNLHETKVSDKPGITVSLISGIGLPWTNPESNKPVRENGYLTKAPENIDRMNFSYRFPLYLFNILMLFVFFYLLKRLFNLATALIAFILIGLSPILLGISLLINPDALLWTFLPFSILCYFVYLKEKNKSFLYWTGLFLGLAILTKYVAAILYVFFLGIIFLEYIFDKSKCENGSVGNYIKASLLDYLVIFYFSLVPIFIFLPASWTEPQQLLTTTFFSKAFKNFSLYFAGIISFLIIDLAILKSKIIGATLNFIKRWKNELSFIIILLFLLAITFTLLNTYLGMAWYDFESIAASPKSSYSEADFLGFNLANFCSLIFAIHPLALLGIIASSIFVLTKTKEENRNASWILYLIIFILLYYLSSSISKVSATVRYQIILYPLAFILSSFGIYWIIFNKKIKEYVNLPLIIIILVITSATSLWLVRPHYFTYGNLLLPSQYVANLKDMGDGSYEAAQQLNILPNAEKLLVWSDKGAVCDHFIGGCRVGFSMPKHTDFDYFVISRGREARTKDMKVSKWDIRFEKLYDLERSKYKIELGGRSNNWVKIIRADQIPEELYSFKSLSFAVVGDTQNSFPLITSPDKLQIAANKIKEFNPDFAVAVGDLIETCTGTENCKDYFGRWKDIILSGAPEVYAAIGNHDYQNNFSQAWEESFEFPKNEIDELGKTVYSFDYGNGHFIVLNSELPGHNFIDSPQSGWLEKDLEKNKNRNVFVIFHSPFFPSENDSQESKNRLYEILNNSKAKIILTGHKHLYCYRIVDDSIIPEVEKSIHHFIIGNTNSTLNTVPPDDCNTLYYGEHFAIVKIKRNNIEIKVFNLEGELIDSLSFDNDKYYNF